ncbi:MULTISPECIES: hypothetical protein [Cyanophyceae]|uniref:hypothetical protein n=1 Tax=Cyanophyceae TaxID=3028117 RepID=UPI001685D69C|nr:MULTISPECIES: hypothetical protein [Cyanophyceae]MBD1917177.1 hypothetical protein [Phormidium sp. FACHB-77]MBD2030708.1 hypothetical protein [Phormidium sp. FACHB-322]MBD2050184.1 hypothetical protein [Leptolyngbya sp. FACHB-60]
MKQILIPLPLALLLAAPAFGQVEARYGSYTLPDGKVIPEGQNRPPATHDAIAFRPNCEQVAPVGQTNGTTAWVLNMPDGAARILATYPADLDGFEAKRYLSNDGLCAWGGVEVPIIYTAQLPQQQQALQVSNPTGTVEGDDRPSANWLGVGAGALLLAAVAGVIAKMATAKPKAAPTDTKAKAADALDDLLGGGK